MLGPSHVMGFAVGNELELLYTHGYEDCVDEIWDQGRLWQQFAARVQEIDEMGFNAVPVTSVFTASVLYGGNSHQPFMNVPGRALVNDFLVNATRRYGARYVFTFNIYPYFDPTLKVDPPRHTCESALEIATCFGHSHCLMSKAVVLARQRMQQLTRRSYDRFWIGEIGWSSPMTTTLDTAMASCPNFSSLDALHRFYKGFLEWDLTVHGVRDPDHVFYFTLRDAMNFGYQEHFGLLKTCQSVECKIKSNLYRAPPVLRGANLRWLKWSYAGLGLVLMVVGLSSARASNAKELLDSDSDSSTGMG